MCPGGAQEVILMKDETEIVLFLKSRYGLVKLAMQYGVPLVPVFTFGQRATYSYYVPKSPFIHWVGRKIGFIPMIFCGIFGLPFTPPLSKQLTVVVGEPIEIPKIDHPTSEQLKQYHTKLIESYEHLYNKFKDEYGHKDIKLRIA